MPLFPLPLFPLPGPPGLGSITGAALLPGRLTLVPEKIKFPPLYFGSCVNLGLAANISLTVVLFSLAIEERVSPLSTVTFVELGDDFGNSVKAPSYPAILHLRQISSHAWSVITSRVFNIINYKPTRVRRHKI